MTREKKRKLSILTSIVGVILLIVVVVTSDEFKEKFTKDREMEKLKEIAITSEQSRVFLNYENYEEGIEFVEASNCWQKKVTSEIGVDYEVWGEKKRDDYTIVYGRVNEKIEVEENGEIYEDIHIYPWIAKYDSKENLAWVYAEDTIYNNEWITELVLNEDEIIVFTTNDANSQLADEKIILSTYSLEGEKITSCETDIWGSVDVALAEGENIYGFVDKKVTHNNAVYKFKLDGTTEEIYECASEKLLERGKIVDMVARGGKLYFSAYVCPIDDYNKGQYELGDDFFQEDEDTLTMQNADGTYYSYFATEKLNKLKEYYTALLVEYDTETGKWVELERLEKTVGSDVGINGNNEIVWEVESIFTAVNYSSFKIVGNTEVVSRYYDVDGRFLEEEVAKENGIFFRDWGCE